jgi:multiple sugar transport system substrate-binding protein
VPSLRLLAGVTAAVALSVGAAGCTVSTGSAGSDRSDSASPSPSGTGSPSAAASPEPVTLRFAVYGDQATIASYRDLAADYSRLHPNVTVDVEHTPDAATASDFLDLELQHDAAPDVFLADHQALPALVKAHAVRPVDELLEARHVEFGDDYQRVGLESFSANSALQCMPAQVSPLVVFYNKDLLHFRRLDVKGQQPPSPDLGWTWQQFALAAKQMSHGGVKGVYIDPLLDYLTPLVRSAGSDVVDNDRTPTTLTMSDGGTRNALAQVLSVARDRRLTPTPAELTRQGALSRFEHGRLGMMFGTRALVPQLRAAKGLSFDVFPLPSLGQPRTIAQMNGYCISARSRHIQDAADFIVYAVGDHGSNVTARTGSAVPANLASLHSVAFTQPGEDPSHARVFSDAARVADSLPFVTTWPKVRRATQPQVYRLYYGPRPDYDVVLPRMDQISKPILTRQGGQPAQ